MRVVVVGENASFSMGGEASLPLYYFRGMLDRGADAILVCHQRVEPELKSVLSQEELARCVFVQESIVQRWLWRCGALLSYRIRDLVISQLIHAVSQLRIRGQVRRAVSRDRGSSVVLEPNPITPKGVSFMFRVGAPVVIGPLCGGMDFPPAFRPMDSLCSRIVIVLVRYLSEAVHIFLPGKRNAAVLLVANQVTRDALPSACKGLVIQVVESGVDLSLWSRDQGLRHEAAPVRFVFSGRFVDWKGVGYLVDAFASVAVTCDAELDLIGGGELEAELKDRVRRIGLGERVRFHGWLPRPQAAAIIRCCHVFVLPSLRECGGTVLLEAMAMGLPIICTAWGGPNEYVNDSVGIRVLPSSPSLFVDGLADAMMRLARSSSLRESMGAAGRSRVRSNLYDWDSKIDEVKRILECVVDGRSVDSAYGE